MEKIEYTAAIRVVNDYEDTTDLGDTSDHKDTANLPYFED